MRSSSDGLTDKSNDTSTRNCKNKIKIEIKFKGKVNFPTLAKGRLGWGTRADMESVRYAIFAPKAA